MKPETVFCKYLYDFFNYYYNYYFAFLLLLLIFFVGFGDLGIWGFFFFFFFFWVVVGGSGSNFQFVISSYSCFIPPSPFSCYLLSFAFDRTLLLRLFTEIDYFFPFFTHDRVMDVPCELKDYFRVGDQWLKVNDNMLKNVHFARDCVRIFRQTGGNILCLNHSTIC